MSKPLNTFDILKAITSDEYARFDFKGVVPRDKLPQKPSYPSSIIVNTHKSNQSGEHWLALYYDENGMCSFFDSFGMHPDFYSLKDYIEKTSRHWEFNNKQLQSFNSVTCGHYCIYFILLKSRRFKLKEILELFDRKNFNLNDFRISHIY